MCGLGFKAGKAWRGSKGLGSMTVYADVGADCDVPCEDLSCREVEQLEGDVCWKSDGDTGEGYGGGFTTGVTYDNIGGVGQAG